jgi:hypothetical protein
MLGIIQNLAWNLQLLGELYGTNIWISTCEDLKFCKVYTKFIRSCYYCHLQIKIDIDQSSSIRNLVDINFDKVIEQKWKQFLTTLGSSNVLDHM